MKPNKTKLNETKPMKLNEITLNRDRLRPEELK